MALRPVLRGLRAQRVVLASASPRRRDILTHAGLRFEVIPSKFKETLNKDDFPTPAAYAVENAKQKALEVAERLYQKDLQAPDLVIGADTIVVVDGLILEKPVDKQDAYRMLSMLSGRTHLVVTGVALVRCCPPGKLRQGTDGRLGTDVRTFHEETRVTFSTLSQELLWDYIDSGEPMDKAGGYALQAQGGMLVEAVQGDALNVIGFPLNRFCRALASDPDDPDDPDPPPGSRMAGQDAEDGFQATQAAEDPDAQAALVAAAFDLSGFRRACHVGGGAGALARALRMRFPRLELTVWDSPDHVLRDPLPGPPGTTPIHFLPGDVMRDALPDAELYIVGPALLRRVATACRAGAALLLLLLLEAEAGGGRAGRRLRRLGFTHVAEAGAGRVRAGLGVRGGGQ
ncbi:probable bifunctional dTTP/UTP pyrophosphatase/methyltransferase protein isoform X2 [Dipodomys merriami]|uniref:probable bifunctional dTTP/UTP pyrophosphatase/methyltransferase protein isoform X2 n=1 Tax=Dipodomys merriami TaxID=94247 RepID=UPI0038559F11